MFLKYASNLLQDISDECMLKSFACNNEEDSKLYRSISQRIDRLITRIGVEESVKAASKSDVKRSSDS
jgi:hypothetical protein